MTETEQIGFQRTGPGPAETQTQAVTWLMGVPGRAKMSFRVPSMSTVAKVVGSLRNRNGRSICHQSIAIRGWKYTSRGITQTVCALFIVKQEEIL